MSFILDALRKSESERQRDAAPSLARIPEAIPQRRLPLWAVGTIGALAAGVIGLGGALWFAARAPQPAPASSGPQAAGAERLDAGGASVAPRASHAAADGPRRGDAAFSARPADAGRYAREAPRDDADAADSLPENAAANSERSDESAAARLGARDASGGSRDLALPPARSGGAADGDAAFARAGPQGAPATVESYETAAAEDPSLPALTLEFHAFADDPARRFVYINGEKYTEGQTLKEGPTVVDITADGVVLAVSGRLLLLPRK